MTIANVGHCPHWPSQHVRKTVYRRNSRRFYLSECTRTRRNGTASKYWLFPNYVKRDSRKKKLYELLYYTNIIIADPSGPEVSVTSEAARLFGSRIRTPLGAQMILSCVCVGTGFCNGPLTRTGEYYRKCVTVRLNTTLPLFTYNKRVTRGSTEESKYWFCNYQFILLCVFHMKKVTEITL